jgi:hypothetical protein
MSFDYESRDMPETPGDDEEMKRKRAPFYAILKRVEFHKEFFDRAYKLQIRCGALFGQRAEDALLLLQKARREIEVSAGMLMRNPYAEVRTEENLRTWEKFRTDVWAGYNAVNNTRDTVTEKLDECTRSVEAICRPTVERAYGIGMRASFGPFGASIG